MVDMTRYQDAIEILERAFNSPNGVRIETTSKNEGLRLRQKIYMARKFLRLQSKEMYPQDHPLWGQSPYEDIVVENPSEDELIIKKFSLKDRKVENL